MRYVAAIAAMLMLLPLAAAEPLDAVQTAFSKPWVWGVDRLAFRRHVDIANQHNYYRLDFVQWQAEKKRPPAVNFWLHEPRGYGSFSRPISDFFQLTINDIPVKDLHVDDDSVRLLPADASGRAGCTIFLNYDGARVRLEWTMRPQSALLHCRITPEPQPITPIHTIRMRLLCVPSTLRKDADNKVQYGGVYARQALTPARVLTQSPNPQSLTPADRYVILQDQNLSGGGDENGAGPCFLTFDFTNLEMAILKMEISWLTSLDLTLKPDFTEFRFALWQHKTSFTNQQFQTLFTAHPKLFTLD